MKTIFDHIEHVKGKPHHIRKQIAFGVAASGTALIALVWFVSTLAAGTFAIQGNSFAQSTGQESIFVASSTGNTGQIAGAAAPLSNTANAPAHIEIVNATTTSQNVQAVQTTIPF